MGQRPRVGLVERASPRRWTAGVAALLVGLVCVAFWPAMSASYVSWDDQQNFVSNEAWRGLGPQNLRWMFTTFHMGHYTPLSWLSFGIQFELWGGHPAASHGVNIGLHAVNAVLFFFVVRGVLRRVVPGGEAFGLLTLASGIGAVFFAVHPLRVESVAWATERRDLLSTAFLLAALLAYLRAVEVGAARTRDWRWYWVAVVLTLLSCASKAWGMSFFVVLMVLDVYPLRRVSGVAGWFTREGGRVLVEKVPFALVGVATAVMASKAQATSRAVRTLEEWGVAERAVQVVYGLWFYLKETVAPVWSSGHSPMYELPVSLNAAEGRFVVAYVAVAALAAGAAWLWWTGRGRGVAAGLLIYLVQVSPVLGVLQSGDQLVADRYSYLATMPLGVGLAWLVVWGVRRGGTRWGVGRAGTRGGLEGEKKAVVITGVVAGLMTLGLVTLSRAQTRVWHDSVSLWEHAAATAPGPTAWWSLGSAIKRDEPERALGLLQQSLREDPRVGNRWYEYANIVREMGNLREAEFAYLEATRTMPQAHLAWVELGDMSYVKGDRGTALGLYRRAIESVEAAATEDRIGWPYLVMGLVTVQDGRREEGAEWLRKAAGFADTRERAVDELRRLGMR